MATPETLKVNPIQCTGHGVCAELLPELISLDEWGYPLIDPRPVPPALDREARRAVAACPVLALKLIRGEQPAPVRTLLAPGGRPPNPPDKTLNDVVTGMRVDRHRGNRP